MKTESQITGLTSSVSKHRSLIATAVRCVGLAMLAVSLGGIIYGTRACMAHREYFVAKFGRDILSTEAIAERCERAHRLYPFNYYFAQWTAEQAYFGRDSAESDSAARLRIAACWCERGLALNRYKSPLRMLKTNLLRRDSVKAAVAYWEEYVEWNFWNPHNHAVLAELYSAQGRIGKALQSLRLVKGSEYYAQARHAVDIAWRKEAKMPANL